MAVVTPQTDLYLLKCPLEVDQQNQLTFNNQTAQYNYFFGLPKRGNTDFTYQRKDGVIRFNADIDEIREYNYCMYRNDAYSNKWFYAFITDMKYLNDGVTAVTIQTDVWQTWQFDITFMRSFIEREHVSDDTFGKHTVPENLETGDYVCNGQPTKYIYAKPSDGSAVILFQVTRVHLEKDGRVYEYPAATLGVHNGIPQGCYCFGIRLNSSNLGLLHSIVGTYDAFGAGDAIVAISLVPYSVIGWDSKHAHGAGGAQLSDTFLVPKDTWGVTNNILNTINRNTTIDGYTPKNNKLFTGEFNYLYVSNNAGGDITYNWENFTGGNVNFAVASALEQGGSVKIYPQNSLKSSSDIGDGWTEGLLGAKLPAISWISDYYLNWQAVNGNNIEIQTGISTVQFGLSMIGQSATTSVLDFASQVANTMQKVREAQMTPPQAKGNIATGDVTFSNQESGFTFRKMSVRAEYARQIDDYFTMFGYKVNRLKTINIKTRRYWNYIKCIQANIEGNIPQDDMNEIKNLFNTGITFWHDASKYLDYSQNNTIV